MSTTCLLVFLVAALSIVLGNRRITCKQLDWWAAHMIAVGMFLVGRCL